MISENVAHRNWDPLMPLKPRLFRVAGTKTSVIFQRPERPKPESSGDLVENRGLSIHNTIRISMMQMNQDPSQSYCSGFKR